MQTTMHRTNVMAGQGCSYATRSMKAQRVGARPYFGNTNGFRAIKAQKRQRLGVTGRSGMNIVCEKVWLQVLKMALCFLGSSVAASCFHAAVRQIQNA